MNSLSSTPNRYPYRNEPIWSRPEKAVARKVFDAALKRELQEVMQEAKRKANQMMEPGDLWALERYLTRRRNSIDRKYDFRLSRLARMLGRLLCERRISEAELRGLGEDKMKVIRACAEVLSEDAA